MRVWIIQPGVAPYRIKLFTKIHEANDIDLTVVLLCEQVPFQRWKIELSTLPFKTLMAKGVNKVVKDSRVVHDREVQFSFPLIWHMLKDRPDVIVCSGFMMSTLLVYIVSRITRTPFLIWNEGTKYTDCDLSNTKYFLRKLMAKASAGFIVAGTLAKEYVQSLFPHNSDKNYYLSCNCVDNQHFEVDTESAFSNELRKRLPERYLLFVGRLIETKGIKEMMEAYRDLVKEASLHDIGIVIVGEGRLKNYIEDFSRENHLKNVFIEGFVEQDKIQHYYANCSAFVLASLSDPNPLVIFEAMASGKPIVCSKRAGNAADFIIDGENGYSVDPYNHEELVDRLKKVLNNINPYNARVVSENLLKKANYDASSAAFLDAIRSASNSKI